MNLIRRKLLPIILGAGICLLLSVSLSAKDSTPDFTLPDVSGSAVSLSDYEGQVVVLNFWASWCGPCREEMPLLNELYRKYEPLGFTLLGINVEEDSLAAQNFLAGTSVDFPVLFDKQNSVSKQYDVIAMPSTVIIGRDGSVRYIHHGYESGDENVYQDQIRKAIRE